VPADVPQVVNVGGRVIAAPKLVPVFFADDDATTRQQLKTFVSAVGSTSYWHATTAEYGVGAATSAPEVHLPAAENPPSFITDTGIQSWLVAKIADGTLPPYDTNTIYVLFYPAGVTVAVDIGVDAGNAPQSCTTFGGYHHSAPLPDGGQAADAPYVVVPRCSPDAGLTGIDLLTNETSHELIEASTDPDKLSMVGAKAAFGHVDLPHAYWSNFVDGETELADMCQTLPQASVKFAELPFTVQRTWSNAAASAGADPCVPEAPAATYFNALPVLPDNVTLTGTGMNVAARGVLVPVGSSKTIEVDLVSSGPTSGPWNVLAADVSTLKGNAPKLSFSFDKSTGQNGDRLALTITALQSGPNGAQPFIIASTLGTEVHFWAGVVVNP
jgi:hypothetical protein